MRYSKNNCRFGISTVKSIRKHIFLTDSKKCDSQTHFTTAFMRYNYVNIQLILKLIISKSIRATEKPVTNFDSARLDLYEKHIFARAKQNL